MGNVRQKNKGLRFFFYLIFSIACADFQNVFACKKWNYTLCYDIELHFENQSPVSFQGTSDGYGHYQYYPHTFPISATKYGAVGSGLTGGGYYSGYFDSHGNDDAITVYSKGPDPKKLFSISLKNKKGQCHSPPCSVDYDFEISGEGDFWKDISLEIEDTQHHFLSEIDQHTINFSHHYRDEDHSGTAKYFIKIKPVRSSLIHIIDMLNIPFELPRHALVSGFDLIEPREHEIPQTFPSLNNVGIYDLYALISEKTKVVTFSAGKNGQKSSEEIACDVPINAQTQGIEKNFSISFRYNEITEKISCETNKSLPRGFYQVLLKSHFQSGDLIPQQGFFFAYLDGENEACIMNDTKDFMKIYHALGGGSFGPNPAYNCDGCDVVNLQKDTQFFRQDKPLTTCDFNKIRTTNTIFKSHTLAINQVFPDDIPDGIYFRHARSGYQDTLIAVQKNEFFHISTLSTLYQLKNKKGDFYVFQKFPYLSERTIRSQLKFRGECHENSQGLCE